MRRPVQTLSLALALTLAACATSRPAPEASYEGPSLASLSAGALGLCTLKTLREVAPEEPARFERLNARVVRISEVVARVSDLVRCLPEEDDDECVRRAQLFHPPGWEVEEAQLAGTPTGWVGQLTVDGVERAVEAESAEGVAEVVEQLEAEGRSVLVREVRQRFARESRKVRVLRHHRGIVETLEYPVRARVVVAVEPEGGDAVMAMRRLQDEAERSRVIVESLRHDTSASTVEAVLACPAG